MPNLPSSLSLFRGRDVGRSRFRQLENATLVTDEPNSGIGLGGERVLNSDTKQGFYGVVFARVGQISSERGLFAGMVVPLEIVRIHSVSTVLSVNACGC